MSWRKSPPNNTSPEAVELRKAAMAWAALGPSQDDFDSVGERANHRLLKAAVRYTFAVVSGVAGKRAHEWVLCNNAVAAWLKRRI